MELGLVYAYIDPASGSIIFQVIIASILGALVYLKKIRIFISDLFRKIFKGGEQK